MLSCSIWFSAPSFWMGVGLESRCVGRVYGADGAAVAQWLRCCATNRKVAGSIPDGVIGIFD